MKHKFPTTIEPAPLPNGIKGGFLKLMGNKNKSIHDAEWKALEAKHEVDKEKLRVKHAEANKPKPVAKKAAPKK